jgi:hypothetical protein
VTHTLIEDANTHGKLDTEIDTPVAEYRQDGRGRRIARLIPNGQDWNRTDQYQNESGPRPL